MNAEGPGSDRHPSDQARSSDQPRSDRPGFEPSGSARPDDARSEFEIEAEGNAADAVGRNAIELAEQLGERLGYSLGRLYRGLQGLGETTATDAEPPVEAATQQAEQLVTKAERQIEAYATTAYHTIRRVAARAREEYEDIAAEQRARHHPGSSAPADPPTRYEEKHKQDTGPGPG